MGEKLKRLAAILKERGLSKESSRVLTLQGPMTTEKLDKLKEALDTESEEKVSSPPDSIDKTPISTNNPPASIDEPTDSAETQAKDYKEKSMVDSNSPPASIESPYKERPDSIQEGSTLKVGSKNKKAVRRLQKALVRARFELPRFGIDGLFGRETKSAVIAFKEKAASDGKYSGKINGIVNKETIDLIDSYANRPSTEHSTSSEQDGAGPLITKGDFVLYLGDSQMAGPLGKGLMSAGGSGKRLAKVGSRASYWANHPTLINMLEKGPSKIIISLNGNGISGTGDLLNLIHSYTKGEVPVRWTGAPPPIRRRKSWAKSLNSDRGFAKTYDRRNKRNKTVEAMVQGYGWTFINPYDYIKYSTPKTIGGRVFESGYTCGSCDGIHLPSKASHDYVSKISSLL